MVEHASLMRALYSTPLPVHNRLVAGVEARVEHSEMEMILPAGRGYQYFSLFVQDEFRPIEQLILTGGARLETQLRTGLEFFDHLVLMPRASAVWLPAEGHSLRLAYGQAIFSKGAFIEFGEPRLYDGALNYYAGSPLDVEEPTHIWEVGYRGQLHDTLLVTLSYAFRLILSRTWAKTDEEGPSPHHLRTVRRG